MTTKNLLVELFVEELPPKALKKLGQAFGIELVASLNAQNLISLRAETDDDQESTQFFASPRRLAVWVKDVLVQAPDKAVSQKLMPVAVGLDAAGSATPALLKKLQALGADASAVSGLKRVMDGKAEALFYESTAKGAMLAEGLQKALLEAIAKLPIPKVMSYQLESGCELPGWSSVSFVRPAHSLLALHGSEVVPISALGLKAGNSTQGHRFEAAKSTVVVADADAYANTLEKDGAVIASFEARKAEIVKQLAAAAAKVGGGVKPIEDDALLDEVTALVERPNVLICEFEKQFLDVPQECLILTMKANQKYFPMLDASGKLTNQFLVVSNISPADASAVIGGNERVVRPRLADAKFFFDQDRKKTLESRIPQLAKVVYHNKLGSQGERVERVRAIARAIGQQLGGDLLAKQADRAALLAKADLLTDMVGEFPELQGIMGGYYALNDKETPEVAAAVEDHYKPRFAGDELPRNQVGVVVALADKLETLVGMFGIGNLPTGDKDPFALRRHALGVIRMLVEKAPTLQIIDLIARSVPAFGSLIQDQSSALNDFIYDRFAGSLREQGYSAQEVDAVISLRPQKLAEVAQRLAAVRAFAQLPEAPALAAANKRVGNILKKVEGTVEAKINSALLQAGEEQGLADALKSVAARADSAWANGQFEENLKALAALKEPVDAFFDKVMVNHDDPAIRANRLGLLASLHQAMNRVADLSKLAA
ncbi:glycine--tRNA ligase subunit beta [Variovorax sp. PCZ-1]|uniref:glycine--tRNA ligase subunit beta n=1 Tax=Variovorax sp. PCZ-1 TaxID=2835533 RepID=UPI001BCFD16B|nr:glycine--tRNA ligase subunit beta [Variovorax sp. PCZ-1]MBS7808103.1 glycine--tRNA ligase subunit beta [Variovorax sp. PCZ-1]